MKICGIGDLHLDGKLAGDIPKFNDVIGDEVRAVLTRARRNGARLALLYGDICERPRLSDDALRVLLEIFSEFQDMKFIVWKGNHDTLSPSPDEACSLDPLYHMAKTGFLKHVKLVRHTPTDFFTDTDHPIRVLPWPYTDTKKEMLNCLHVEVAGAHWETGRPVDHGFETKHLCVIGHLHKAQKVRRCHYAGTLYQTTFGEPEEKFYHDIDWDGDVSSAKIRLIPHSPRYVLKNAIIRTEDDYAEVCKQVTEAPETTLWKVLINSRKILLPVNAFDKYPTIIKHTPYTTKAELQAALEEDLVIDDRSSTVSSDTQAAFTQWMNEKKIEEAMQKRANDYISNLIRRNKEPARE